MTSTIDIAPLPTTTTTSGLEDIYQKLVDVFLEQKYYRPFHISILKRPLRLVHLEEAQKICNNQEFEDRLKLPQEENEDSVDVEQDVQSSPRNGSDLPEALNKFESFQYQETLNQIIYLKPLRFGCLLNSENKITEFSVSESQLELDLSWIIQRFISQYDMPSLKLESNRFVEPIVLGCGEFSEPLVGLRLSQLSLDRTRLHACDLSALFKIQAEEISMRFCSLKDEDVNSFTKSLAVNGSLKVLNLNFNQISNSGCKYLAQSLKLNRTLNCLSLMCNYIENAGCEYILQILGSFLLTRDELLTLRKIKLDKYIAKLNQPPTEDQKPKVQFNSTSGSQSKKPNFENKVSRKSRMLPPPTLPPPPPVVHPKDVPLHSPPHVSKIPEENWNKKVVYETCVGSEREEGREKSTEDTTTSCTIKEGKVYCDGNFSLTHLYLSHNNLTPDIIPLVLDVLNYQEGLPLAAGKGLTEISIWNEAIKTDMEQLRGLLRTRGDSETMQ